MIVGRASVFNGWCSRDRALFHVATSWDVEFTSQAGSNDLLLHDIKE